jgi:hypothetical protein
VSRFWNWLRWITLPSRHRREIEQLDADDMAIRAIRARIDRQMAEMGMDQEKWWEERGRYLIEGRQP